MKIEMLFYLAVTLTTITLNSLLYIYSLSI